MLARETDREGVKMYKRYIDSLILHFKARWQVFPFMSYWWDLLFFLFKWCICEGLCAKPFCSYLQPEPRIRQDRTCCLKWPSLGSLARCLSYADLEIKSMEWGLWRWQSFVPIFLTELIFNAALTLLSCQSALPPTDNWLFLPSPNCVS